ncbi:serine/threonine-protein kinase pim-1-like [Osmerus mordax]|uniref:serine/threonine-protein kinase pim-1-like n=1 Tax=Osmerus mordax TaxID=8014 RepID=UPI00350F8BA0
MLELHGGYISDPYWSTSQYLHLPQNLQLLGCSSAPKPQIRRNPPRRASFTSLYTVGDLLGEGGYGAVYEGKRKEDSQKVAIKFVPKHTMDCYLKLPGTSSSLPVEVALMQMVSEPPTCEYVLKLIEWFEQPNKFILILERPDPCMDLFDYTEQLGGRMDEGLAREIMQQVVVAVLHCRDRGVLHRDIKVENLLLKTDTLKVKLIDFGCGDLLKDKVYKEFAGTAEFYPPEWVLDGSYQGRKATIWSLGVLLFNLVCGKLPFKKEDDIVAGRLYFRQGLSKSSRDLIRWCLTPNPTDRPDLEQILQHDWFSEV